MTRKGSNLVLVSELMEPASFTLRDLCERCGTHAEYIIEMVEFGILEPEQGLHPRDWRFDCRSMLRVHKAIRLQNDLSLNLPGLAVSLDLIDEVESLRKQVAELQQQLSRILPDV